MFRKLSIVALTAFFGSQAFAIYDPSWERPVLAAEDMEIRDARFGFEKVIEASLVLTKRDGQKVPTGMNLSLRYRGSRTPKLTQLVIRHVGHDDCGSIQYSAGLPQEEKNPNGARMSVFLTDHSTRVCDDMKKFQWEAHVREGFGWCGTGDATMDLSGDPEPVVSIQRLPR